MICFKSEIQNLTVSLTIKVDGKDKDISVRFEKGEFATDDEQIAEQIRKISVVKITEVKSSGEEAEALKKPAAKKPKTSAK